MPAFLLKHIKREEQNFVAQNEIKVGEDDVGSVQIAFVLKGGNNITVNDCSSQGGAFDGLLIKA